MMGDLRGVIAKVVGAASGLSGSSQTIAQRSNGVAAGAQALTKLQLTQGLQAAL